MASTSLSGTSLIIIDRRQITDHWSLTISNDISGHDAGQFSIWCWSSLTWWFQILVSNEIRISNPHCQICQDSKSFDLVYLITRSATSRAMLRPLCRAVPHMWQKGWLVRMPRSWHSRHGHWRRSRIRRLKALGLSSETVTLSFLQFLS